MQNVTGYKLFEKYSGLFLACITPRKEGARSQSIHKVLQGGLLCFYL